MTDTISEGRGDAAAALPRHAPGLRLHPRTMLVERAGSDLRTYVNRFWEERDLTAIELGIILTDLARNVLKHKLRAERHPRNPDKKADEA